MYGVGISDHIKEQIFYSVASQKANEWQPGIYGDKIKDIKVPKEEQSNFNQFLKEGALSGIKAIPLNVPHSDEITHVFYRLAADQEFWKNKISPVIAFYQAFNEHLSKCASHLEFDQKLAQLKLVMPKETLLLLKMQSMLSNIGVFDAFSELMENPKKPETNRSLLDNGDRYYLWYRSIPRN